MVVAGVFVVVVAVADAVFAAIMTYQVENTAVTAAATAEPTAVAVAAPDLHSNDQRPVPFAIRSTSSNNFQQQLSTTATTTAATTATTNNNINNKQQQQQTTTTATTTTATTTTATSSVQLIREGIGE